MTRPAEQPRRAEIPDADGLVVVDSPNTGPADTLDGFEVHSDVDGPVMTLTFRGELDIDTLTDAERAVAVAEAALPQTLVLNLSTLGFMDSSGVRLVLQADDRAREAGRRLAVVLGEGRSRRLFDVLGLVARLDVLPPP